MHTHHPTTRAIVMSLAFVLCSAQTTWAQSSIKSFKEWKLEQVTVASANLNQLKHTNEMRGLSKKQNLNKKDPNLVKNSSIEGKTNHAAEGAEFDSAISNEQNRLEMARDLSVTDYFVGYLAKQANRKEAYKEAAGKLSPDEVAELLSAYANSVFDGKTIELSPSAAEQGLREH